jgi:ABC-type transport system involved in multi-copper enzyme maturation permease subunit
MSVTQVGVVRSEWVKLRSLRSTLWTLLAALGLMVGIGGLLASVSVDEYADLAEARAHNFDATSVSLNGVGFAQLAIGVLGVLMISGEYGTGMIRATLAVVPRRLPVLWAKLAVFAGVVFVVSLTGSVASFFAAQQVLRAHRLDVGIGAPGALRSVVGAALYLTVAGLIGVTLGALLRNTAAGISTFVAAFFIVPPLFEALPASIDRHVTPYLPSNAGQALYRDLTGLHWLSPWTGFAVLCAYAVVLVGLAAWRLLSNDA